MPTRCGSKAWAPISPASSPVGTPTAWTVSCCWRPHRSALVIRAAAILGSRPTAAFAAAASKTWCRSYSQGCRSRIRACSRRAPRAPSPSISYGTARSPPGGRGACAWRGCGCTSARPRPWPRRNSASTMRPADLFSLPRARRAPRRIFTVPHGRPFLRAVAEALLAGQLPSPRGRRFAPLELAGITLLLPTRRDITAVQEAFLEAANGAALLLPKVKLISHLSDTPAPLAAEDGQPRSGEGKPQIGKLERELALARLVLQWSRAIAAGHGRTSARTPAQAVRQAQDLARLMDMAEMEDVSLAGLEGLVPQDFSTHWELTLDFLKIVTEHWPPHLEELGKVSPAGWRKGLMLREAERLGRSPPAEPTIVAGVTGTVPAATQLMRAVLALEQGALILPALDLTLDEESWNEIVPAHPEHPQFGLKKLLDALGVARSDVALLPGPKPTPRQRARARCVSEAMRPASTTERWHAFLAGREAQTLADALAGCTILEAASAAEEAEAIALILREAAEHPSRTAVLVTPDRALAHRVSVRLKAWALEVPDLSGRPLASTAIGVFLDLLIEAAAQHFSPIALLSLLKHPLLRAGLEEAALESGIRTLELAAFRAPYLGRSLADIGAALERAALGTLRGQHRGRAVRGVGTGGGLPGSCGAGWPKSWRHWKGCSPPPSPHRLHVWPRRMCARPRRLRQRPRRRMTRCGRATGAKSLRSCLQACSTVTSFTPRSSRPPTIRSFTAASSATKPCLPRGRGTPASPSQVRSKPACSSPTLSFWAPSTKAPGRRRRTRARGSTAACAMRSGCRRPRNALARRPTTLPRSLAPRRSISRAPAK